MHMYLFVFVHSYPVSYHTLIWHRWDMKISDFMHFSMCATWEQEMELCLPCSENIAKVICINTEGIAGLRCNHTTIKWLYQFIPH